jgi:hypothetical protein
VSARPALCYNFPSQSQDSLTTRAMTGADPQHAHAIAGFTHTANKGLPWRTITV